MKAFDQRWVRWAGWPRFVSADRGVHNRGVFGKTLVQKGVRVRPAGPEAPEQIGRTERRGDMLKSMMKKVIKETHAVGREEVEMVLTECLNALSEMSRHGWYAPAQWVLNRLPRAPATHADEDEFADIGAIQAHADGPTTFALQAKYRLEAQ